MLKVLKGRYNSTNVTEYYIDIIAEAFALFDMKLNKIENIGEIKKEDVVLTTNVIDAFKVINFKRNVKVVNWYQGIIPEESYFRNKSFIRKKILNFIEIYVLNNCKFNFFVSNSMKIYYRKKYNLKKNNYLIMPCFNTDIIKKSFFYENKYRKLNIAYVGGLSKWQCFDKILDIYFEIEKKSKESKLLILTYDQDNAKKIIKKKEIKNYEVNYVPNEKINKKLQNIKYGFLLRKINPINYVSTPTKMSTYLANGVIPIFTSAIGDFNNVFKDFRFKIKLNCPCNTESKKIANIILAHHNEEKIESNDVFIDYKEVFNGYYNRSKYINNIKKRINEIFIIKNIGKD